MTDEHIVRMRHAQLSAAVARLRDQAAGDQCAESVAVRLMLERLLRTTRRNDALVAATRDIARTLGPVADAPEVQAVLLALQEDARADEARASLADELGGDPDATPPHGHDFVVARESYAVDLQPTKPVQVPNRWRRK